MILLAAAKIVTESSSQAAQFAHLEQRNAAAAQGHLRAAGGFFDEADETTTQAPVFTTPMKSIQIREGQRAHFEARIIPVSDATMKIEWFHNGQPLKQGTIVS